MSSKRDHPDPDPRWTLALLRQLGAECRPLPRDHALKKALTQILRKDPSNHIARTLLILSQWQLPPAFVRQARHQVQDPHARAIIRAALNAIRAHRAARRQTTPATPEKAAK
jgi:hypothetical protein